MASLYPSELAVLKPFLPYIEPLAIDSVSAFCAGEPPGWPSITGLTWGAVLAGGEIGASLLVGEALTQIALNGYWYLACQCIGTTTPAYTTPPTPTGVPVLNPPVVVQPPAVGNCASFGPSFGAIADSSHARTLVPLGPEVATGGAAYAAGVVGLPAGATRFTAQWDTGAFIAANHTVTFQQAFYSATNTFISQVLISVKQSGDSGTSSGAVPGGATQFQCWVVNDSGAANPAATNPTYAVQFQCAASPNQPAIPCCPPDPILEGVLTQILKLLTLVQRQAAPFAYVYGANHAALSGHGSISVSGLIGVSVDVTTLPSSYGQADGSPLELFGLGYVTLGTGDGWSSSRRIDHDGSLVIPPSGGVYTVVGYSLSPGVVVSIRELVREP